MPHPRDVLVFVAIGSPATAFVAGVIEGGIAGCNLTRTLIHYSANLTGNGVGWRIGVGIGEGSGGKIGPIGVPVPEELIV
jgi:hypothetical protein